MCRCSWLLLLALTACGGEGSEGAAPSATAAATASVLPSATASASAIPSGSANAAASAATEAEKKKDWGCGKKGQELCPMQGWMKKNVSSAISKADTKALAEALDFIAKHPVEGYEDWTKIAEEGAKVARAGDLKGAKKSCKACHKLHQKKYKRTMRDAPWPDDAT